MERAVFATLLWRGITKAGPSPRSAMKQQEMGSLFYGGHAEQGKSFAERIEREEIKKRDITLRQKVL